MNEIASMTMCCINTLCNITEKNGFSKDFRIHNNHLAVIYKLLKNKIKKNYK